MKLVISNGRDLQVRDEVGPVIFRLRLRRSRKDTTRLGRGREGCVGTGRRSFRNRRG
jgi:hypothetical protein